MEIHPLLPSTVGLVRCKGNFPGSSPWEAHCSHKQKPMGITGCAAWEGKLGPGRSFWIWSAREENHHPARAQHVEVEGTFLWEARAELGRSQCHRRGASPCQVLSPEKCQQNFPGWISHPSPGLSHAKENTTVSKLGKCWCGLSDSGAGLGWSLWVPSNLEYSVIYL